MIKSLLLGASLATAVGFAASAQPAMPGPDHEAAPSAAQAGVDASAVAKPGMVVTDNTGATVGTVTQVGKTAAGESAVVVRIDGQPFTLAADKLSPSGGGLVSSMTKAEIKAAPKAPN
jgi:hypothetical protein